jgi:hypothetical protein
MRQARCDVLTSALPECQFVGTLEAGAPCGSGYQCKTGSCSRTELCGTCSPRVPTGSDCTQANCQSGLLCAAGTCKALSDVGAACGDAQPCKPSLECVTGKCQPPLGAGAACTPATASADVLSCDAAQLLYCVAGTCTGVRYAEVGQSCGLDGASKQLVACTGSSCSSETAGTCVADRKEGEACASDGPPCEVPLSCIDGRCGRTSIAQCQ